MSFKSKLHLDWASYKGAKYACEKWHYSKCMPRGKLVKFGVWEDDRYIGVIIFGLGATPNLSKILNLKNTECCELVRVALNEHSNEVTKMIAVSLRMLKKFNPKLKAVISVADKDQGHDGIIYKAGNWKHIGFSTGEYFVIHSKKIHPRTVVGKYGTRKLEYLRQNVDSNLTYYREVDRKHRYVYYFDKKTRVKHRVDAVPNQGAEGGLSPTNTLQKY